MCSARNSTMVSTSSGSEAAAASSGLGGNWNRLQIFVVMVWKPAGSARIAGEPNSVIACRKATSAPASSAGMRERNGDAARRRPGAAAEDRGRILEIARDAVERIGDQHEHIGKGVAGNHEDQAGQRVDVEQVRIHLGAGERAPRLVDQPGIGRRQKLPRNGAEKRRGHERGRHQRPHHVAAAACRCAPPASPSGPRRRSRSRSMRSR